MAKADLVSKAQELGFKNAEALTVEELEKVIEGQEAISLNDELIGKINELEKSSEVGTPILKIDDKSYSMPISKMVLTGKMAIELGTKSITREEVKEDAKLAKALVEAKSGFLVELED